MGQGEAETGSVGDVLQLEHQCSQTVWLRHRYCTETVKGEEKEEEKEKEEEEEQWKEEEEGMGGRCCAAAGAGVGQRLRSGGPQETFPG